MTIKWDEVQEKYRRDYRQWRSDLIRKEAGFFALYQDFLPLIKELSAPALRVYLYIGMHSNNWTGESWHSLSTIAKILQMDPRTVRRALQELVERNLVARVQKTPRGRTFTYLRPLPRTRPLAGKELEEAAEALLVSRGYSVIERGVLTSGKRRVDFIVEDASGKQWLVEIKRRITLDFLMTWSIMARRLEKGLILIASDLWPDDVQSAA
uniref:helix-turn-helix domain-containing protein n=1 Tax=Sulfobacillus thermosulfidooxidans TaxID=28034 RepID=UPI000B1104B5